MYRLSHFTTALAITCLIYANAPAAAIKLNNVTHEVHSDISISNHTSNTAALEQHTSRGSKQIESATTHSIYVPHSKSVRIDVSAPQSTGNTMRSLQSSMTLHAEVLVATPSSSCIAHSVGTPVSSTTRATRKHHAVLPTTREQWIQTSPALDISTEDDALTDSLSTVETRPAIRKSSSQRHHCLPKMLPDTYEDRSDHSYNTIDSTSTTKSYYKKGQIRRYNFTISRATLSPDGVSRDMIVVNGQFPGPMIEANVGDTISVTVYNNITQPEEGTALHWHGFQQQSTPWQDGVPSVSQCPIAPGQSYQYDFMASEVGTSFYHAHYSAQYTAGVAGPIVIYGPSVDYDCDVGPVMITDWYHIPYFTVVSNVVGNNPALLPPTSDNSLIQGIGTFNCSNHYYGKGEEKYLASGIKSNHTVTCEEPPLPASFSFLAGKTHKLRLINHGADGMQRVSIDNLNMTIIAIDFVPVTPRTVTAVTLAIAQRVDVLVHAPDDKTMSYWLRASNKGGVTCGGSTQTEVKAAIYHENADATMLPTSFPAKSDAPLADFCINDDISLDRPSTAITPRPATFQQDINLKLERNETGHGLWTINDVSYKADYNRPLLLEDEIQAANNPYDPHWNVYNFGNNDSIVLNVTNQTPFAHPFHLHGYNFFVLHEGPGLWDGSIINGDNPLRRDTHTIRSLGHIALQIDVDNPGIWPFHCHVAWHLSGGLAMNLMVKRDQIKQPAGVRDLTCNAWQRYSSQNVVDQIDAGS